MRWRLTSPGKFYDRDEAVVVYFHPASGDTHLLTGFASELLKRLHDSPVELRSLVDAFPDLEGDIPEDERLDAVEATLDQLAELDLVEQV